MTRYVIIDSVSADQLSVPMTLAQCRYIQDREIRAAQASGEPCTLAVVATGSDLRHAQEAARRRMAGNPPKARIIYDGPQGH